MSLNESFCFYKYVETWEIILVGEEETTTKFLNEWVQIQYFILSNFNYIFVYNWQGCDASLLLNDSTTIVSEQTALGNNNSIRGLDVVNNIKTAVEASCPNTVSCADILAIAAEVAVVLVYIYTIHTHLCITYISIWDNW